MSGIKHTPTEEQQAVIEAVAGRDSVMVDALAGCTKTTTLEMAAPQIKVPALGLAFNKKTATEFQSRVPGNFTVKTFNGLGHGALLRGLPTGVSLKLEDRKLGKLVTEVAKERKVDLSSDQWDELRRLVEKVQQAGITPGDRGKPLAADTLDNWAQVADQLWITEDSFDFLYDMARDVLQQGINLVGKGVINFDDQVYYSTCIEGKFPQYPVIFVDEAQDLSPLNHAMLAQCVRPDGRLVVVGDPKQAIYAFRGADSRSMGKIRALRPGGSWADRGLLTTFRCPKSIVARQLWHAPGYKAWHTNAEGRVAVLQPKDDGGTEAGYSLDEGWNWKTIQGLLPHPQAKIMVICRNNSPLLSLAFKLIRAQIGVVMLGRDIEKGLLSLSKKILPEDDISVSNCVGLIRAWMEKESSLAQANDHPEKISGITDRGECLLAVAESGCADSGELRHMLSKLFARETGQVELSSGHRAKGLECDVVVHLDPWRIPSKWAREAAKVGDHSQMEQENNLRYVIETRTKHTLINCSLEDFSG